MSRDDAVVRLQGRRKEEPRREPVPVTGPPAGRRTRHTAPYRPLLSHSLPPPLYALRPSRPVCYLLANLASRFLQPVTRLAFKFFKQCQLACTTALIMLPSLVTMLLSANRVLSFAPFPSYPRSYRSRLMLSHVDFVYNDIRISFLRND